MEQFAQFSVDGQRLYGMLHVPEGEMPTMGWPSVVMLHGFTGGKADTHRLFVLLSRLLMQRGIASLRFDFRGSGDSQGDFSEMTISREGADTQAAFEYLRRQPTIDPQRVMLLGYSMGAIVASFSLEQVKPHRLALWAPALPELWLGQLQAGVLPPTVTDYLGWPLGRAFLQEMFRLDPLKSATRWGGVARVFHGDADLTCPHSFGLQYAQALGSELVTISEAGHSFESLIQTDMLYQETARFLLGAR